MAAHLERTLLAARIGIALAVLSMPGSVAAYCRTTTIEPRREDDCRICPPGTPLFWPTAPILVTPHEHVPGESSALTSAPLPPIDRPAFHDAIERAMHAWTDARCADDQRPSLFSGVNRTTASVAGVRDGANVVAIVPSVEQWLTFEDATPEAFGLTYVHFNPRSGEIVEADVIVNPKQDCVVDDCAGNEPALCDETGCEGATFDLENVLAHEMGHFFGFAHVPDAQATMHCAASPSETIKRSLEEDDLAAVCDVYPPGARLPGAGFSGGCSAAPTNAPVLALAWLVLLRRARSRSGGRRDRSASVPPRAR